MKKRILSILLTLCMVLMLCPVAAFAEEGGFTVTIDGPDVVCAQQEYEFTVTAPEGVTLDKGFGFDTGSKGSGVDLTIDENGVGHGVMLTEWYDLNTNYFDLIVYGYTADQQFVSATKRVQVSQDHVYVDGVCGCGAVLQYIVEYIGSADDPICMEVKTHGKDLTLRGETFTREGFIQIGWRTSDNLTDYPLGGTYTGDADITLYPVWDEIGTVTVPYTTTVALGDAGEPGKTTFELALVDTSGKPLSNDAVTVSASVTTNGAGSYDGVLTLDGPKNQIIYLLQHIQSGTFVRQVDAGAADWTLDGRVWGLTLDTNPESETFLSFQSLQIYPVTVSNGKYYFDENASPVDEMTFTNTYTAHSYELNHDAYGHWDECDCGDIQNKEAHKYGDWKVTKEATEKEAGEKEHTCTVCGYVETAAIEKLAAKPGTDTPATGDNSHMALWIALLFVSGAVVIGTTVYSRKKRAK